MRRILHPITQSCKEVFRNPGYALLALLFALIAFLVSVWLPNIGLMREVLQTSHAPLGAKLKLFFSLIAGIRTNFSLLSAAYTIVIAALFGLNIAAVIYYLRRQRYALQHREIVAGFGGAASGVLGVGCAACGSFVLSSFLSLIGSSGALALFPLRGGEFGILSVILLSISFFFISRKIARPLVCQKQ